VLRVRSGADLERLRAAIQAALPPDVEVLTKPGLVAKEQGFWDKVAPIGTVFNIGVVMGFIVGLVICYQVLYSDVSDRLGEFATLKAMGYSNAWLFARVVVVPFLAFTFVIGSIVHVHHIDPAIEWLRGDEWTKFGAQMEGTTVLRAGPVFNFFLHWIMVHTPHHVDMRIPMYHLDKAADAIERAFPGTVVDRPLRFRDFVANSRRCKLYDFDAGRWLTYREAVSSV